MSLTTKEYLIKTVYDNTGLKQFSSDVEKAKYAAQQMGNTISNSAKVMDVQVTNSFNKAGQSVRGVTTIFSDHGRIIKSSFQEVNGALVQNTASLKKMGSAAGAAGIDLGQLISRAALTIPVWFALRSAIMGVFTGVRDGITNLVSFDLALQKIKRNLSGTPEEITSNFGIMKKEITAFSLETGKSVEEISTAVKNFATIGFNFKDSLSAGLEATRLSILLFGDAGETANAFASAMKLLVKEGEGLPSKQQQIAEAFALTAELAKNNKDNLGELTQGLNKFSATAATANLSVKETITLLLTLATAGRSGSQSGTLLSTTFNNLLTSLDKVAKNFGIQFNPAVDSGFETLMKVLDASEKLAKLPGGEIQVIEKLKDVLGGERGTKVVSSLLAVNNILKENMKVTGDVGRFHKDVTNILDTESGQAQILSNSFREMGKSFVSSVLGANDFKDAIKKIHEAVEAVTPALQKTGIVLHNLFTINLKDIKISTAEFNQQQFDKSANDIQKRLAQALRGELSKTELEEFKIDFSKIKKVGTVQEAKLMAAAREALSKALSKEEISSKVGEKANIALKPVVSTDGFVIRSLENELAELKARLKAKGATDIQLAMVDVEFLKSNPLQDFDKIRDAQSKIRIQNIEKERTIQETLVKAVEDGAKAEGASNLEAISRRIELEKQLGIERTGLELLTQQIELQKAITEETKKTKEERLKDLEALLKSTPSAFSAQKKGTSTDFQEQRLINQASFKGISNEVINKILNPEEVIAKSGIARDLQNVLTNPMTRSMGSLESALSSLTKTILQQESSSLSVGIPRTSSGIIASPGNGRIIDTNTRIANDKIKPVTVEVGDINVTVSGEGSAEDIAKRVGQIVEDMIAAKIVQPGTKPNIAVTEVFRKE